LKKFQLIKGNWIVKKTINKNISIEGCCHIKNISKCFYELKEFTVTNFNNKLIPGHQKYKIFESKNNITFYLDTVRNKDKHLYKFNKNKFYKSIFFCKKDIYLANFNILTKNFFTIYTKIKGPKKNLSIFAKYYRSI
tara:strand:- start:3559 stop:3969 length:411 start_codon:yes stop_codon:yes gene_type:complete